MPVIVSRDQAFYAFSPDLIPAVKVAQGEEVILETHDCFGGQLQSEDQLVESLDWSQINPATGPVYFEGVRPGDVLRVDLLEVSVPDRSTMVTIPGEGALGDVIEKMETAILRHEKGHIVFKDKVRIPANPMIGVIGVAPAEGSVPNGTPGPHGGNMDCTLVAQGARVSFTAGVEGGLLGCGDMHAVMGDGEIVVCGAETPGRVRLRAQTVPMPGLPTPFIETDNLVATVYSAATTDEAYAGAIHRMAQFLTDFVGLSLNDAGMLMSLVGDLKFCQVVDPLKTVRFEFPKWALEAYGYRMLA